MRTVARPGSRATLALLSEVSADGTSLVFAGYVGGAGSEVARGVAVDPAGNTYVAGSTDSTEATFPVTVGPDLSASGSFDAFVAKIEKVVCALPVGEVQMLLAVKAGLGMDDAAMQWQADPAARGYNIWYVLAKADIPLARQGSLPPAVPVSGCAPPAPASGPACTDRGAVPRGSPAVFFYQVRAFCDPMSEGP